MQLNSVFLDKFAEFGPVSRNLSWLIRPSLIAKPGHTLVWGDWSAIEARTLPWLAASRGAEAVLDVFRANDADPSAPDIYEIEAGNVYGKDPKDVTKDERMVGKVDVLSLGYGGGNGALGAMATNYGIYLSDDQKTELVHMWRDNNPWARRFWNQLWEAALNAMDTPDTPYTAGRVAYVYDPDYMKGTLFCALPCGRILPYPRIKWEQREVENKQTGELELKNQLTYLKGYGRAALWYGKQAENVTQAVAGSILRRTLVWLEGEGVGVTVGHTHDEIVREVSEDLERYIDGERHFLRSQMEHNDEWDQGLPLKAEITDNWYYTKAIG